MADEPKNNIEDALKAYARKRREDAGAFEMHPATRQILQTEVAKLRGKPAAKPRNWLAGLFDFGPRLGFALSIVVVLAVVYLAWRSPSSRMDMASTPSKTTVTADGDRLSDSVSGDYVRAAKDAERRRSVLSEELAQEQAKGEADQLGRATDSRRKASDEKLKLGAEVALQDRAANQPMPAGPTPAEAAAPAELSYVFRESDAFQAQKPADKQMGERGLAGNVPSNATVGNESVFYAPAQPVPPAAPAFAQAESAAGLAAAAARVDGLASADAVGGLVRQRFYKAPSPQRAEQPATRLLEEFELQRTDNQIRIIDSDGSVYEGAIAAHQLERREAKAELEAAKRDAARSNAPTAARPTSLAAASAPADTPINFRATGTNRTLNQLVVFDGTMRSDAIAPTPVYFKNGVQAQSGDSAASRERLAKEPAGGQTASREANRRLQLAPQMPSNRVLRVEGKARVGATNQLEIRALPR